MILYEKSVAQSPMGKIVDRFKHVSQEVGVHFKSNFFWEAHERELGCEDLTRGN